MLCTYLQLNRLKRREPIADNFVRRTVHTHRLEKRIRDLMLPEEFLLNYFETSQQPNQQEQALCEKCPPSILKEHNNKTI